MSFDIAMNYLQHAMQDPAALEQFSTLESGSQLVAHGKTMGYDFEEAHAQEAVQHTLRQMETSPMPGLGSLHKQVLGNMVAKFGAMHPSAPLQEQLTAQADQLLQGSEDVAPTAKTAKTPAAKRYASLAENLAQKTGLSAKDAAKQVREEIAFYESKGMTPEQAAKCASMQEKAILNKMTLESPSNKLTPKETKALREKCTQQVHEQWMGTLDAIEPSNTGSIAKAMFMAMKKVCTQSNAEAANYNNMLNSLESYEVQRRDGFTDVSEQKQKINAWVDKLIKDGIPPADAYALAAAIIKSNYTHGFLPGGDVNIIMSKMSSSLEHLEKKYHCSMAQAVKIETSLYRFKSNAPGASDGNYLECVDYLVDTCHMSPEEAAKTAVQSSAYFTLGATATFALFKQGVSSLEKHYGMSPAEAAKAMAAMGPELSYDTFNRGMSPADALGAVEGQFQSYAAIFGANKAGPLVEARFAYVSAMSSMGVAHPGQAFDHSLELAQHEGKNPLQLAGQLVSAAMTCQKACDAMTHNGVSEAKAHDYLQTMLSKLPKFVKDFRKSLEKFADEMDKSLSSRAKNAVKDSLDDDSTPQAESEGDILGSSYNRSFSQAGKGEDVTTYSKTETDPSGSSSVGNVYKAQEAQDSEDESFWEEEAGDVVEEESGEESAVEGSMETTAEEAGDFA